MRNKHDQQGSIKHNPDKSGRRKDDTAPPSSDWMQPHSCAQLKEFVVQLQRDPEAHAALWHWVAQRWNNFSTPQRVVVCIILAAAAGCSVYFILQLVTQSSISFQANHTQAETPLAKPAEFGATQTARSNTLKTHYDALAQYIPDIPAGFHGRINRGHRRLFPLMSKETAAQSPPKTPSELKTTPLSQNEPSPPQTDLKPEVSTPPLQQSELKQKRDSMQTPTPLPYFYSNPFNLSSLTGSNGFVTGGLTALEKFGNTLATGNINGAPCLIIGVPGSSPSTGGSGAGGVYVIFSRSTGWPASFDPRTLDGTNGFYIPGIVASGALGTFVAGKDTDGDGFDDLLLGGTNVLYIVYGAPSPWPSTINLTTVINNSSTGAAIYGLIPGDGLGASASVGDYDNNGENDLFIGAPGASTVYAILQQLRYRATRFNLATIDGSNGIAFQGSNDALGTAVEVDDLNGNGFADVVMGAPNASFAGLTNAGRVYIAPGNNVSGSAIVNVNTLSNTGGTVILGKATGDQFGFTLKVGDFTGDNNPDIVVGAFAALNRAGSVVTLYGPPANWPKPVNLSTLTSTYACTFNGLSAGDQLGTAMAILKFNGDTIPDLFIGAISVSPSSLTYAGAFYGIWGKSGGWATSFYNLSSLNGNNGFVGYGTAGSNYLGLSLTDTADINGDGNPDLAVSAPLATSAYSAGAGQVYVMHGIGAGPLNPTPTPTPTPTPPAPSPAAPATPQPAPISCPSNQPLQWLFHNMLISTGQALRLSPIDISVGCGSNTNQPIADAFFNVTAIQSASLKKRNGTNWNTAFSFFGRDLGGNIEIVQDGSETDPKLNLTATYGDTTLPETPVEVSFFLNQSTPTLTNATFMIMQDGVTTLTLTPLQIKDNQTKLEDIVFYVNSTDNFGYLADGSGYFATAINPTDAITEFTGYQIKNGDIQFIHNGTQLPNITWIISNGGQQTSARLPVQFFALNNSPGTSTPLGVILGSVAGVLVLTGLVAFGVYKADEKHRNTRKMKAKNAIRIDEESNHATEEANEYYRRKNQVLFAQQEQKRAAERQAAKQARAEEQAEYLTPSV